MKQNPPSYKICVSWYCERASSVTHWARNATPTKSHSLLPVFLLLLQCHGSHCGGLFCDGFYFLCRRLGRKRMTAYRFHRSRCRQMPGSTNLLIYVSCNVVTTVSQISSLIRSYTVHILPISYPRWQRHTLFQVTQSGGLRSNVDTFSVNCPWLVPGEIV